MLKVRFFKAALLFVLLALVALPAIALAEGGGVPGGGGGGEPGPGVGGDAVFSMRADTSSVSRVGDEFTVDILLANANNLAGVAFEVSFDPAVLGIVKDADGNSITANPDVFQQAPDDFGPNPFYRKDTDESVRLDGTTTVVYFDVYGERQQQPLNIGAEGVVLGTIKFKLLNAAPEGTRLDFSLHELIGADAEYILNQASGAVLVLPPGLVDAPVITAPADNTFSRDTLPVIYGTGLGGALLRLYDGGSEIASITVPDGGTWDVQVGPLGEGVHVFSATQEVEGNASLPSNKVRYIVDTVAPQPPVITIPQNGSTVTTLRPEIAGAGEKRATVTVYVYDGAEVLGTTLVNKEGNWVLNLGRDLTDQTTYTIKATQTDRAGNTSGFSNPVTFRVDTGAVGGNLKKVVVTPGQATLGEGRTIAFTANGYDQNGVSVNIDVVWRTVYDYGSIDQNGVFTALAAGTETVVARAYAGGSTVEGTATVNIYDLPTVSLLPSKQTAGVGQEFTVDVAIVDTIAELYGFQFDVNFNPQYLRVVSVTGTGLLSSNPSDVFAISSIDNGSGTLSYAETLMGDKIAQNVSGAAATITFKVRQGVNVGGENLVTQINLPVEGTILLDGSLDPLEVNSNGATVEIVGGGTIHGFVTLPYKLRPDAENPTNKDYSGVEVTLEDAKGVVNTTTTNQDGYYSFTGIPEGTYKIVARKYGYLTQEFVNAQGSAFIQVTAGSDVEANLTLPYGEFGDGKVINITDISKIARQFNKAEGQEGYDLVLDWSRDGRINITDISAAARNFNKRYTPQPWV